MNTWSILGIDRTQDPEAIESAYEYQLRFVDPDTDPDAYRALRRAYENAMQEAGAAPQDEDFGAEEEDASPETVEMPPPPSQEAEIHAGQVMTELETVFSNPGWRDDIRRWRAQLEGEKAHKSGVTEVLRFRVFEFLSRQATSEDGVLHSDIMEYLDERLGWHANRRQLEKAFPQNRVDAILGEATPSGHSASSPLDIGPFPDSGNGGDLPQGLPKGIGFALIGWVVILMILTILFGGMR
ncbi:hypothetical protein DES49_2541 [Halospina denitrificans]|uniref:DnaJ-like protein n=1 Tax=Halospina denitrificans TaxID=332522 RepID=A0A4R7JLN1_9GAMM|nr:hypothetical protein [Halospina denitrificans]TDT38564.1 hypothetical protein DES49_2541 [Halospina denitrificans]